MRRILLLALSFTASLVHAQQVDVLVYGATPAGIAAALAAAEDGEKVLLVERSDRIGGMMTSGLSHADFRTFESLSGAYLAFTKRVEAAYGAEFGPRAAEVSLRGTQAEPKVNLAVFEKMLAEQPRITVQQEWALEAVAASSDAEGDVAGNMRALEVCLFADAKGERHSVPARYFIDATYEGDLVAAAGVPYAVGREARTEFGERLAPEQADAELQAYNFRWCMTRDPALRVAVRAPEGYTREEFAGLPPLVAAGTIASAFGPDQKSVFRTHAPLLPHAKADIDDTPGGPVRVSLTRANENWPDGGGGVAIRDGATPTMTAPPFSRVGLANSRQRVTEAYVHWGEGLLYFLQNDAALPEAFRAEARAWGWCRDEFPEDAHRPDLLYAREARRLIGAHLYTENDSAPEPGDARAVLHRDAVAIGDVGPVCAGTGHAGSAFGGLHTGEFAEAVPPYQVPYGVMVPREMENLLVAGAVSASHVGYCTVRFEPVLMALGEAAGYAVHLARGSRSTVQNVPVAQLQSRLHRAGAATVYVADVPASSPDYAAVQWWGTAGGLHGTEPAVENPGQAGKTIVEGYSEAFPHHAAMLEQKMDAALMAKWRALAADLEITKDFAPDAALVTRGDFIRAAWQKVGMPR